MKKNTKRLFFIISTAIAGMHIYNRLVSSSAAKKNMLPTKDGSYYAWNQGNIFYTKTGKGSPVLLIHDTNSSSSSVEWSKIINRIHKKHTVYTIDLLGCGLSDKPAINYTSYIYVQLVTSFIKNVIKEKTDIVTSNLSSPFVIMANHMENNIINKIILINPVSLKIISKNMDTQSRIKQTLINIPVLGTFIYNILMNPCNINRFFQNNYYLKPQLVSSKITDAYYQSAHMDNNNGKYLFSSIIGNYMNTEIKNAIKKINKPLYIINSHNIKNNLKTIEEYRKLNSNIEVTNISGCRLYPQLENPEKTYQIIDSILNK